MQTLLLIADARDSLVDGLAAVAGESGRSIERLSYPEAAKRLTVRRSRSHATVEPQAPIFLRPPLTTNQWLTRERQFHEAEMFSLVWAAAALTAAPVVNRPDGHGFGSRSRGFAAVLRQRAGVTPNAPEVFSNDRPRGPYGAAVVRPDHTTVNVTVAGVRAFAAGERAVDASLCERARNVCAALGVAFATVTWRLPGDGSEAELAFVSQCPMLAEIGDAWPRVASAVLEELMP